MNIIEENKTIEFIERKSKFIGYIKNVNTVEEAQKYIKEIRELHPNATHIVPVYRLIENKQEYLKYNDDGEPQGTAAKPMADIIIRKDIY
ncbi:MAG: YigZ family protein, partial [Sneathia sanguinegens]